MPSLIWLFAKCPEACAIVYSFGYSLLLKVNICAKAWQHQNKIMVFLLEFLLCDETIDSEVIENEIPIMIIIKKVFLKAAKNIIHQIKFYIDNHLSIYSFK